MKQGTFHVRHTIQPGAVVTLASGGPRMTVESTSGSTATVVWFTANDEPRRDTLPAAALRCICDDDPEIDPVHQSAKGLGLD